MDTKEIRTPHPKLEPYIMKKLMEWGWKDYEGRNLNWHDHVRRYIDVEKFSW